MKIIAGQRDWPGKENSVKNVHAGRLTWSWALVLIVCATLWSGVWAAPDTTATGPAATAPAQNPDQAATLAENGLNHALAGKFDQGLDELRRSSGQMKASATVTSALKLLNDYHAISNDSDAERSREYKAAVEHVRKSLIATEALSKPAAPELAKSIRAKILGSDDGEKSVVGAYNRSGTAEKLLLCTEADSATKLQASTVKALEESLAVLTGIRKELNDLSTDYARTLYKSTDTPQKALTACVKAWKDAKVDTEKNRGDAVKAIRDIEDELLDAMSDLEIMVAEKPYLVGMSQARVAILLAPAELQGKILQEDWARQLMQVTEKLGQEYIEKADWYSALGVYGNLQELAPDNEGYKTASKTISRHVRVLRLYGQKAATQPATATADDEEELGWKELVKGVDVEMARTAISEMENSYVTAPDFRKLAKAALNAIKVLAETPQAKEAFPLLDVKNDENKKKVDAFVAELNSMTDGLANRDRMDATDVQLILNGVLHASDKTVCLPKDVLAVEFVDGLLEELDKFSNMVWPSELDEFRKAMMGNFYGVGIQITKEKDEPLKVMSPLENSPALAAGIKCGDQVLAVDGVRTEPLSSDALIKMITGPKDTKVKLTVKSPGKEPREVVLTRGEIQITTVKGWRRMGVNWDYMIDPQAKIGYIRMTQFTELTHKELLSALSQLRNQGARSLILDLRFNPGGLLKQAGLVADEFLKDGKIVSTKGRQSGESEIDATPQGHFLDGDVVVLVNQGSASAAEIVAGALKDLKRATIIGQRSYGKGSVQNVIHVSRNKAILKITTAYYYLPSGRCVHRRPGDKEWGVDADVDVMLTPRQSRHWLELRKKTDLLLEDLSKDQSDQLKSDLAEQFDADVQLNTAVLMLRLRQLKAADDIGGIAESK